MCLREVSGSLAQHKFVPLGLMCPGGECHVMNAPAPLKSVAVLSISLLFAGRFNPIIKSSFEFKPDDIANPEACIKRP